MLVIGCKSKDRKCPQNREECCMECSSTLCLHVCTKSKDFVELCTDWTEIIDGEEI